MIHYPKVSKLTALKPLIGSWHTEGKITNNDHDIYITGTDTYEWVLENSFIVHKVDVMYGKEKIEVLEVISESDYDDHCFRMVAHAVRGEQSESTLHIKDKNAFEIYGDRMKALLILSKDGESMKAYWQRSDEHKNWLPWMEMKFTKIHSAKNE